MSFIKFKDETNFIYESINNSMNLEQILKTSIDVNNFKQAIENGINNYHNSLKESTKDKDLLNDDVTNNSNIENNINITPEIYLSSKQLAKIEEGLSNIHSWKTEGCDCGDFIVFVEGLGYFTLSTMCRKSSGCPDGTLWNFYDEAYIYDKSVYDEVYDWDNIKTLYKVNTEQTYKLIEIANNTIMNEYGCNEYGEELF